MSKKILCCIFSYDITKGMKSYGHIGLLKSNDKTSTKDLLYNCIKLTQKSFKYKSLYTVLGFEAEKIKKKIEAYKFQTHILFNNKYSESNQGHAFKLFLSHLATIDLTGVSGVVFLPVNILIHKLPKINYKKSWVVIKKKYKKYETNDIGCTVNNNMINYMFYGIGSHLWTEVLFLNTKDIQTILKNTDNYYDNMFLFEVINTMIEKQKIQISTVELDRTSDIVKINGLKDKSKIKIKDTIR